MKKILSTLLTFALLSGCSTSADVRGQANRNMPGGYPQEATNRIKEYIKAPSFSQGYGVTVASTTKPRIIGPESPNGLPVWGVCADLATGPQGLAGWLHPTSYKSVLFEFKSEPGPGHPEGYRITNASTLSVSAHSCQQWLEADKLRVARSNVDLPSSTPIPREDHL